MTRYIIKPDGWPCTVAECPPGAFMFEGNLCFKSEYRDEHGHLEVFNEVGEVFWAGTSLSENRDALIVQPVLIEKEQYEP